jgi:hypothetical protein
MGGFRSFGRRDRRGGDDTKGTLIMRRLLRLATTLLLAGSGIAGTAGAASAGVSPLIGGTFHWIRNSGNSGLCLEPQGLSTAAGVPIVQATCATSGTESIAQGWQYNQVGTNHYKFVNQLSGLCLDANDIVNGAAVVQWPCASISNQEFNTGTALPAVAKIESRIHYRDTGYCIDEPGGLGTIGAAMQVYVCNGTPAQIWINGF